MDNLILITVDCLRSDHTSCLGYSKKITPEIDKIAKKGALFTQAISTGSWTSFSFPSILTSTFPLMHEITSQKTKGIHFPMRQKVMVWNVIRLKNVIGLAEVLKKKGYSTAGFHSNPYTSPYFNYGKGFDCYEDLGQRLDIKSSAQLSKVNRWKKFILNKLSQLSGKFCWFRAWYRVYLRRRHLMYSPPYANADLTTEKGFSWLKKNSRGFFLWLRYMDPHRPYPLFRLSANDLLKYFEVS